MGNFVPTCKQPYLYFTIADNTVDVPSLKIIKINSEYAYISYIADIIPEDQTLPVKQTQFSWSKIQDLPNYQWSSVARQRDDQIFRNVQVAEKYSWLANYIETCFPYNASIVIRSNMFHNKISGLPILDRPSWSTYSKEKLHMYIDIMFSIR
jgi:hypothetical protein